MCCVGNDDDLRQVTLGADGAFAGMKKGAVFVDHTTASAEIARELYKAGKERGFDVHRRAGFRRPGRCRERRVDGDVRRRRRCRSRARRKSSRLTRVPATCWASPGAGQLAKMVNQICIAGLVQGLSEGLHFAKKAGLDIDKLIATISKGAAQSWQMENRYKTMTDGKFDFGFAVDWMRKDLGICLSEARRNGAHLPVTALVDQFYSEVQSMGGKRWDTSSLIARLER